MALVEKVTVGKTPKKLMNRTNKLSIKMERNILGGFLFCWIHCAVTFVPLNNASHHTRLLQNFPFACCARVLSENSIRVTEPLQASMAAKNTVPSSCLEMVHIYL